ncbi:MAG: CDP-alcohol phosphatidyltransferase family protein [Nitrospinaceae bacterium]|nr:CDP-alcohol phosphatidyltransferase family protein [Nitrospinaceae bacterium]
MNQKSLNSSVVFQKHVAILFLPYLPEPKWYLKKIAGVPFLLRNILVLQKMGVERLVVWAEDPVHDQEGFLAAIKADKRLQVELDWANKEFISSLPETLSFLIFDGSTLLNECGGQMVQIDADNFKDFPEELMQCLNKKEIYFLESESLKQPERLRDEKDFYEAEEGLLKSCGLSNDSFMDRLITRFISRQLTSFFLKTSFTPNQITFLSLVIGLVAALCFFSGGHKMGIAGSILLLVSAWVDCADGEVARLKFMTSEWGAKLDIISDNIVHCSVFFAIGMGLYFSTGESIFKYLGMLAVLGSLTAFILLSKTILGKKAEATKKLSLESCNEKISDQLANRDFIYLLFALALFGRLDAFILLTAAGSNFFAIYLVCQKLKTTTT